MDRRHYFVIDGELSSRWKVYFFPDNTNYEPPEKDVTTIEVPGRNGDLVIDGKRYKNREATYKCICLDWKRYYREFTSYLSAKAGYVRLEETTSLDYFRMARFVSQKIQTVKGDAAVFQLTFDCKPQLFLRSGEDILTYSASGKIVNPTQFASKPLLTVTGFGHFLIGNKTITVNQSTAGGLTIDTEMMEAYHGSSWLNSIVELPDEVEIPAGISDVTLSSVNQGFELKIQPRWYIL